MKRQIIVRENRSLNICSTKRSRGSSKRRELYRVESSKLRILSDVDPSELKLAEKIEHLEMEFQGGVYFVSKSNQTKLYL